MKNLLFAGTLFFLSLGANQAYAKVVLVGQQTRVYIEEYSSDGHQFTVYSDNDSDTYDDQTIYSNQNQQVEEAAIFSDEEVNVWPPYCGPGRPTHCTVKPTPSLCPDGGHLVCSGGGHAPPRCSCK